MKPGWKTEPLGDLCEFQRGLTYTKGDEVEISDNIVLRATNIDLTTNLLDFAELKYINDKVVVPDSKKVKKNSLIICTASGSKSHLGKVAYIDDDYHYAFGGFMGMITPKNNLVPKYLFHLMTSSAYKNFIGELSDGVNINNLKFDDLEKFPVPYPTYSEQQRIVEILDKALEGIATAKVNSEKNLQNTRELFEAYLQNVFANPGDDWEEKTLGEVCEFTQGIQVDVKFQSEVQKNNQVRFLRIVDFTQGNELPRFIDNPGKKYILNANDVSLVRYGASTGFVCRGLVGALANNLFRVIPKSKKELLDDFLCIFLKSPAFQNVIKISMNGAAMPAISFALIEDIVIPIMSLKKQRAIVDKLNVLSAETKKLEAIYQQKLANLEELKKSILQKAFNGELTGVCS